MRHELWNLTEKQKSNLKERLEHQHNGYVFETATRHNEEHPWLKKTVYTVSKDGALKGLIVVPDGNHTGGIRFYSFSDDPEARKTASDLKGMFVQGTERVPPFLHPQFGTKRIAYEVSEAAAKLLVNDCFLAEHLGAQEVFKSSSAYNKGARVVVMDGQKIRIRKTTKRVAGERKHIVSFISLSNENGLSRDYLDAVINEAEERPERTARMIEALKLTKPKTPELEECLMILSVKPKAIFGDLKSLDLGDNASLSLEGDFPEFKYKGKTIGQVNFKHGMHNSDFMALTNRFLKKFPEVINRSEPEDLTL